MLGNRARRGRSCVAFRKGGFDMENPRDAAVPLTILTGFLGAGKTTLLNRILSGSHGLKVGVLVNDFGAINIDAELVVGVEGNMASLSNGCVCCQIRDDLTQAVEQLLVRPEPIDYVLLEASGVADPAGIMVTFNDEPLRDRIRLDSISCVVDAEQVFAYAEQPVLMRLKMLQIACADMMILNKVDLAGPAQVARVRAWIEENYRRVRVVEAVRCEVPLEVLLAVGRFNPALSHTQDDHAHACDHHGDAHHHGADPAHDHGAAFSTWSFESDRPVSLMALREMVRRELPASVYRCKGIVHAVEAPGQRAILQVVGRRSDVFLAGPWRNSAPRTRIVAIGAPGALEAERLSALFDRCLVAPEAIA
jgi:G3E family GTPase